MLTLGQLRCVIAHEVARNRLRESSASPATLTAGELMDILRSVDPSAPVFTIDARSGDARAQHSVRAGDVTVEDAGGYSDGYEFDDYDGPMVCIMART